MSAKDVRFSDAARNRMMSGMSNGMPDMGGMGGMM